MKPKIIIRNQNIKIVKDATITTFGNTTENINLIKEHLELTPMTKSGTTYVVNGGPLAQTIETLKARQAEFNKPDLPPDYLEALEDLTAKTESESINPNLPPGYAERLKKLAEETETEPSDTDKAKPPKKSKKAD